MLLTFSKPEFENLIKDGVKKHTIRVDKYKRWRKGMKIHFWSGNPRNTRAKNKPHQFGTGECFLVQPIAIEWSEFDANHFNDPFVYPFIALEKSVRVWVCNVLLDRNEMEQLAKNDGFENAYKFFQWFSEDFEGRKIHWKDCTFS